MKYKEIFEQIINEINMSPAGLRSLVANINAQAGMEFEMIVPGAAESEEGDDYLETNYDADESIRSIQDAYDFFYDGDYNDRRSVERLRDQMTESYYDWLSGKLGEKWEEGKEESIYDWLRYNAAPSDVFGILEVAANASGDYPDPTKDDYWRAAAKVVEDRIDPWYEDAEQDFNDNFYRDADMEDEWLEDAGIQSMADVENQYSIVWPHYHNPDTSGGGVTIQDAAESFAQAIGREVKASDNYHSRGVTRPDANNLHYVVEPDGSLEADDDNDGGLEFVNGKAYKPDVDMLEGSYSLLIGHYLESHGAHFLYCDPLTDDPVQDDTAAIVFLAHNRQITYGYTGELPQQQLYFTPGHGSIIVDPWRRYTSRNPSYKVIHYGNTRSRD